MRIPPVLFAILILLAGVGCESGSLEYWINPDGSGKVTLEYTVETFALGTSDPVVKGEYLRNSFGESEGVSQWSDLRWQDLGADRYRIQATAYFDDINKLVLPEEGHRLRPVVTREAGKIVAVKLEAQAARLHTTLGRSWAYNYNEHDQPMPGAAPSAEDVEKIVADWKKARAETVRDWKEAVKRAENMRPFQQDKAIPPEPMLRVVVHLPGKVAELRGASIVDEKTLSVTVSQEAWIKGYVAAVEDDQAMHELAQHGGGSNNPLASRRGLAVLLESVCGEAAGPSAKVAADDHAWFDCRAELAAKKKTVRELLVEARLQPADEPRPAEEDNIRDLRPTRLNIGFENRRMYPQVLRLQFTPPIRAFYLGRPRVTLMTDDKDGEIFPALRTPIDGNMINDPVIESGVYLRDKPRILIVLKPDSAMKVRRVRGVVPAVLVDGVEEMPEVEVRCERKKNVGEFIRWGGDAREGWLEAVRRVAGGGDVTSSYLPQAVRDEYVGFLLFNSKHQAQGVAFFEESFIDWQYTTRVGSIDAKDPCVFIRMLRGKNMRRVNLPFEVEDYEKALTAIRAGTTRPAKE